MVTQLPFNRLIGLEAPAPETGLLVSLPEGPQYANHLGTVHASALQFRNLFDRLPGRNPIHKLATDKMPELAIT